MAIAIFPLPHLFGALQSFLAWLVPPAPVQAARSPARPARLPQRIAAPRAMAVQAPARPLRVVRVLDPSASHAVAGRMRISGRMADVCAELDRLAALEASRH